jgi:CubicO group peptidase (beta-lactamase class C family)
MTKLLTTIAALQVVEQGLFKLDGDTSDILPDLAEQKILKGFNESDEPILDDRKTPITLHHLLTHTSGAAYDAAHPDLIKWQQQRGKATNSGATVETKFLYPLVFEPGSEWMYGTSIDWAGKLVERLTKTTLEDWMTEHIFKPLGVTGVTFWPNKHPHLAGKVPALTARGPDGKLVLHTEPTINESSTDCFGGHGGYAQMSEYLKIQRSILANDGKILKPETVEQMFTPQLSPHCKESLKAIRKGPMGLFFIGENDPEIEADWGLGGILFLQDDDGRRKKGTMSWGGVSNTFWIIDREADLALAFGTQVLPPGDRPTASVITQVEKGMYEKAGVKF